MLATATSADAKDMKTSHLNIQTHRPANPFKPIAALLTAALALLLTGAPPASAVSKFSSKCLKRPGTVKRPCQKFPNGIELHGNQVLRLTGAVSVTGKIQLYDSSRLIVHKADLTITEPLGTSETINTFGKSRISMRRTRIRGGANSGGGNPQWQTYDNSQSSLYKTTGQFEITTWHNSAANVSESEVGTISIGDAAQVQISNSLFGVAKPVLTAGAWKFADLPQQYDIRDIRKGRGMTRKFSSPSGWNLTFKNTDVFTWVFVPINETDLTLTNVDSASVEVMGEFSGEVANLPVGPNLTQDLMIGDFNLHLHNTGLIGYPWHFALGGNSDMTVIDSQVTEAITWDSAHLTLRGGIADAWYIIASGKSRIDVIDAEIPDHGSNFMLATGGGTVHLENTKVHNVGVTAENHGIVEIDKSSGIKHIKARDNSYVTVTNSDPITDIECDTTSYVYIDDVDQCH